MDGKVIMIEINYYPNNFESVKGRKEQFITGYGTGYVFNHPHRLPIFKYTGTIHYEFDDRIEDDTYGAEYIVWDVDLSLMPHWTRAYQEELPIIIHSIPDQGKFICFQYTSDFWSVGTIIGEEYEPVKVGERITKTYSRDDPADPWTEDSSTTTDIMMSYTPGASGGGGSPLSGGRGADNEANSADILGEFTANPGVHVPNATIFRLPWEDPWDNESDAFTDAMADYIAAKNTVDPGCWSGSTTMTLELS